MMVCSGIGVLIALNWIREEEDEEGMVHLASELDPGAGFCGGEAYRAQVTMSAVWDWGLVSPLDWGLVSPLSPP